MVDLLTRSSPAASRQAAIWAGVCVVLLVAAVTRVTAERGGKSFSYKSCEVVLWRNGQVAEEWVYVEDLYAFDDFWS